MSVNTGTARVPIGIDAAVVAPHQIAVRGEVREDFTARPTLAGLAKLTERLEPYAGTMVVAEPTAGTWLPLAYAVSRMRDRLRRQPGLSETAPRHRGRLEDRRD